MAGRAANLARELKNIKSELHFMQERCGLLEEENKRLRDGYDNGGAAHEEDDLVRKKITTHLCYRFSQARPAFQKQELLTQCASGIVEFLPVSVQLRIILFSWTIFR